MKKEVILKNIPVFLLFLFVVSVGAGSNMFSGDVEIKYSPFTTDTVINDHIHNLVFHGFPKNVYDGGTWKDYDEVKSLKGKEGCDIVYDYDGVHNIEVLDFNATSKTLRFSLQDNKELNKEIPIKVAGNVFTDISLNSLIDKQTFEFVDENVLKNNVSFGFNSTTVTITAQSDINDSYIQSSNPDLNYGGRDTVYLISTGVSPAMIKINYSSIPSNAIIEFAEINLTSNSDYSNCPEKYTWERLKINWGEGKSNGAPEETGAVTWNSAEYGSVSWTTAGAKGVGSDVVIDSIRSFYCSESGTEKQININGTLHIADVQGWVNGSYDNFGYLNRNITGSGNGWYTKEKSTVGFRPQAAVTYTIANNAPSADDIEVFPGESGADVKGLIRGIGSDEDEEDTNDTLSIEMWLQAPNLTWINLSYNYSSGIGWEAEYDFIKNSANFGSWNVSLNITDDKGLSSSTLIKGAVFNITSSPPDVSFIELYNDTAPFRSDTITIRCVGSDPDDANDTLTTNGYIVQSGDMLNFEYIADVGWEANYTIGITDDSLGYQSVYCNLTDTQGVTGEKTAENLFYALNNPPVLYGINDFNLDEDFGTFELNLTNNSSDVEDTGFNWTVDSSNTSVATVDVANSTNVLTLISVANASGYTNISVWLYDSEFDEDFDSFVLTVGAVNDAPYIVDFNASSDTEFYDNEANVSFYENESVKFGAEGEDIDSPQLWFRWLLDGVDQLVDTLQGWFNWVPSFLDSGTHNVTVYVNDSLGAVAYQEWLVNILNVNNPNFAINFVEPTPDDGEMVHTNYVDVRVEIKGPEAEAPEFVRLFEDYENFTGSLENTILNATFIQLEGQNVNGTYESNIYDSGENVSWDNLSWSEVLAVNGELTADGDTALLFHLNNDSAYGENDTSIHDFSSNGNDGIAYGAKPTPNGNLSCGFEFDGINDYINCGNGASLDVISEATWEAWVYLNQHKATSGEAGQIIISKQESGAGERQYTMFLGQSSDWKNLVMSIRKEDDSSWVKAIDPAHFPEKQWVLVTATYNKSASPSLKLYRNGVQVASDDSYHGNIQTGGNKPFTLGSLSAGGWYFNGTLDEISIWNRSLTVDEISSHANATYLVGDVKFQVRSCDDVNCSGESFTGPGGDVLQYYSDSGDIDVDSNQFFQYKAFLETNVAGKGPELYNMTVEGETVVEAEEIDIDSVWLDWNGVNYTMSNVSAIEWQTSVTGLGEGNYNYKAYANDSYDNSNLTETRMITVKAYEINFSVVDSWTGVLLGDLIDSIECSNGVSDSSIEDNPAGPYDFFQGTYQCNFTDFGRYDKTLIFIANNNKIVEVPMSEKKDMTDEEHEWLEELYDCVINGDCLAYQMWESTNQTVEKIWGKYLPTDESIVDETVTNNYLSSGQNITIDYSIYVPEKEGYSEGDLLPIRIFYWFVDPSDSLTCFSQGYENGKSAEAPFCNPLTAQILGPMKGNINFTVDLAPNLPAGNYNIVRSVEIDPNNVWINYGREVIGQVRVLEDIDKPSIGLSNQMVDMERLGVKDSNSITGAVVNEGNTPAFLPMSFISSLIFLTTMIITYVIINRRRD